MPVRPGQSWGRSGAGLNRSVSVGTVAGLGRSGPVGTVAGAARCRPVPSAERLQETLHDNFMLFLKFVTKFKFYTDIP